jgi:hypothetical protein
MQCNKKCYIPTSPNKHIQNHYCTFTQEATWSNNIATTNLNVKDEPNYLHLLQVPQITDSKAKLRVIIKFTYNRCLETLKENVTVVLMFIV